MVGPFWHYVNRAALADAVLKALRKIITSMGSVWQSFDAAAQQIQWFLPRWVGFLAYKSHFMRLVM